MTTLTVCRTCWYTTLLYLRGLRYSAAVKQWFEKFLKDLSNYMMNEMLTTHKYTKSHTHPSYWSLIIMKACSATKKGGKWNASKKEIFTVSQNFDLLSLNSKMNLILNYTLNLNRSEFLFLYLRVKFKRCSQNIDWPQ